MAPPASLLDSGIQLRTIEEGADDDPKDGEREFIRALDERASGDPQ